MIQGKIRQEDVFKTRYDTCDVIWLLNTIRGIVFRFGGMKDNYLSMIEER